MMKRATSMKYVRTGILLMNFMFSEEEPWNHLN